MYFFVSKRLWGGLRVGVATRGPSLRRSIGPFAIHPPEALKSPVSVYVITNDAGMCKIGISRTPEQRCAQLQTASPHKLRLTYVVIHTYAACVETEAHKILAEYRREGEWFECNQRVAEAAVDFAAARLGKPVVNLPEITPKKSRIWPYALSFFLLWCFFYYLIAHAGKFG